MTDTIERTPLSDALSERYLAYALSTIMARSLPDVRDGLKPVHRRLLWAMSQLRLDPAGGFKKCARVVGDVIGKFHPHGDAAVYEALVRLAQDFAQRYPLVEGQGNFGNIDGDNAAAMRYTESRLTEVAAALLADISADTVDFRPTYDGEESEPVVLPAAFPNLLANGAQGIAVGMATSIPPHNAGELIDAALHLIDHPEASVDALLRFVPGPDFPTGGILVEPAESILEAYRTGRGGFRLRARWMKEELKGGGFRIIVTEIPWQVQKSKLIEQIAQAMEEKKLPLLGDVRDESTETVRLVLEPRSRNVDAALLMESLFRATALETRIALNMNVLDATRTPRVMNLVECLRAWLDHRHEVFSRRTAHRLAEIARRLEVLDGYLAVYLNLDEVIRIIRAEDEPKPVLMQTFALTDVQADAILNMRLRSLRRLEEMEIRREHKALSAEQKKLKSLMKDPSARWSAIADELRAMREKFGAPRDTAASDAPRARGKGKEAGASLTPADAAGPPDPRARRTGIEAPPAVELPAIAEALVEREPVSVVISDKGWIRALKGHLADASGLRFKEGDSLARLVRAETTDRILLFASSGKFFTLRAADLPGGRGDGQPVRLLVDLANEDSIVAAFVFREGEQFLVASDAGRGFVVAAGDALAETRKGKQVLNLDEGERAAICIPAAGDHLAVVGTNRKLLVFPLDQVPVMARGKGVALQKYRDGKLSDARVFRLAEGLSWALGEKTRTETDMRPWLGARAQAGKLPPNGFPRSNRFGG